MCPEHLKYNTITFKQWKENQCQLYPANGILSTNTKVLVTDPCYAMEEPWKYCEKRNNQPEVTLYSNYVKYSN